MTENFDTTQQTQGFEAPDAQAAPNTVNENFSAQNIESASVNQNNDSKINPDVFYKRSTETPQNYCTALAHAIKNNAELRNKFLEIVNPQQPAQQHETLSGQAGTLSASRAETEHSTNCTLDASIAEIESRQPNFFTAAPARAELRAYLRKNCPDLSRDEVYKILNLAVGLENQAIEHYKSRIAHEKNIYNTNAAAISKLATNSAQGKASSLESNKIFTRADIRAMSLDDYRKNEKEIFAQYRAGLIK